LQEASTGPDAWQLHPQCLLAKASLQLPPQPQGKTIQEGLADPQQLPTHAHFAVIDSLSDAIATHLPDWQQKLKAADGAGARVLDDLLAKLQWQVLGVVRTLYCSLARSPSASSPTRKTLDVKVKLRLLIPRCLCEMVHAGCSDCKLCNSMSHHFYFCKQSVSVLRVLHGLDT
jgi:hypothetical protein